LFYCDGSVQGTKKSGFTVRLAQSNENFLTEVQRILHSNGILTGLYKRRDKKKTKLPNGKGGHSFYDTKEQYELITVGGGFTNYRDYIGFNGDKIKETKLLVDHNFRVFTGYYDTIIEINNKDEEPVFCIKEDTTRSIIVNGLSTRRCGEIPLCPNDSCRLLAINLFGYVTNPFTENARFDWDLFILDAGEAQRYMDDIVDLEIEKIDKILEKIESDPEDDVTKFYEKNLWENIKVMTLKGRRTGLGITGEGDMLAALGLTYGTDEATDFSESVHENLKLAAYSESISMAFERGAFPIYNSENEVNNPFILRIKEKNPKLYDHMVQHGRRNIALLTIAPTGCLVEDSIIKTDIGDISLVDLFLINGISLNELRGLKNIIDKKGKHTWYRIKKDFPKFKDILDDDKWNFIDDIKNDLEEFKPLRIKSDVSIVNHC
jgi:ribonucleotide reductase alpha subunit